MGCIITIVFFTYVLMSVYKLIKAALEEENQIRTEDSEKVRTLQQPLSSTEQEELKASIRGRMTKAPDPRRMPSQYREPTPMEVQAYHDVMDECHTGGCDVSPDAEMKENSVMKAGQESAERAAETARRAKRKRNAIIQMMLADSVLHRREF